MGTKMKQRVIRKIKGFWAVSFVFSLFLLSPMGSAMAKDSSGVNKHVTNCCATGNCPDASLVRCDSFGKGKSSREEALQNLETGKKPDKASSGN